MQTAGATSLIATADYRRQARKIRATFATQPLLRHHALTRLARQHDAARPTPLHQGVTKTSARRVPPRMNRYLPTEPGSTASAIERGFADHSADRLRAGTFTFSDRIRLIDSAEKLGIPRFRANMILALEQHRINPPRPPAFRATGQSRSFKPHLLAVLVAEVVMVAALVWVCKL